MDAGTYQPGSPQAPLVSVIMPAFNAERSIAQAIGSVLHQTHTNVEVLVINDGSTDGTSAAVAAIKDPRVRYFEQANAGVSAARNTGLDHCTGAFVCFLDTDDVMPLNGIEARLRILLQDPSLSFADGRVTYCDAQLLPTGRVYAPAFSGEPFERLCQFDPACFFGNTWMIRREAIGTHRFEVGLTHSEDLLFYLNISPGRRYGHCNEPVLLYRVTSSSAMSGLSGLERGYRRVIHWMGEHPELVTASARLSARAIARRIVVGSYWHAGQYGSALRAYLAFDA